MNYVSHATAIGPPGFLPDPSHRPVGSAAASRGSIGLEPSAQCLGAAGGMPDAEDRNFYLRITMENMERVRKNFRSTFFVLGWSEIQ